MGISFDFNPADFDKIALQIREGLEGEALSILTQMGEFALTHAKAEGDYQDRTGNLRNSIGYAVFNKGVLHAQSGINSLNRQALAEAVSLHKKELVLVVVAGMKYAVYLEATDNRATGRPYNVLSKTELQTQEQTHQLLKKLFQ